LCQSVFIPIPPLLYSNSLQHVLRHSKDKLSTYSSELNLESGDLKNLINNKVPRRLMWRVTRCGDISQIFYIWLYTLDFLSKQLRASDDVFTVSVSNVYGIWPLANFQNIAKSCLTFYIFIVISGNSKYAGLNNTDRTPSDTVLRS
jgi:hypothetical protein